MSKAMISLTTNYQHVRNIIPPPFPFSFSLPYLKKTLLSTP